MGSFFSKQKIYELKIYIGVISNDTVNDEKSEEELSCRFKIDMRNFTNFDPSTQKSQKFAL